MPRKIPTNFSFEIINITPVNPYISECQIKVFYTGKNRNGSYISKPVGEKIAQTLPRSPIVAYYNEEIEDFEDHGQELIINKNGIKMVTKTVPYGAVSENGPIVWQQFADADGVVREYLVCNGYLWTGRYPQLQSVLEHNKGQSMEFFPDSIIGDWAKFDNEEEEFFIFNEANISALCILGDDVEPCFEGASIGAPKVLYSLNKNDEFENEFAAFMLELDKVLEKNPEGGNAGMNEPITEPVVTTEPIVEPVVEPAITEPVVEPVVEPAVEPTVEPTVTEPTITEPAEPTVEPAVEPTVEPSAEPAGPSAADFTKLQNDFATLQENFNTLQTSYNALIEKETARENEAKDTVFAKFAVLGEEVLNDIKANKDKFSVEEIEDKLSAIAFRKGISFSLISEADGVLTPQPHTAPSEDIPAWLKAVEDREN